MKTLFLHVGQPKTGTTALQQFCHLNEAVLAGAGLSYLQFGRNVLPINHKFLWLSLLEEMGQDARKNPRNRDIPKLPNIRKAVSEIREEISNTKQDKILISFEGFSAVTIYPKAAREVMTELRDGLRDLCRIVAICYCRDPFSIVVSNYNQRCKSSGFTPPFVDFVMGMSEGTLNQTMTYEFYRDLLGESAVYLRSFESARNADIIVDFLGVMGISADGCRKVDRVNEAISVEDLESARIRNNLDYVPDTHIQRMIYGKIKPSSASWRVFEEMLDRANRDNRKMFRTHFDIDLDPITIADIIWKERELNHAGATRALVNSLIYEGLEQGNTI